MQEAFLDANAGAPLLPAVKERLARLFADEVVNPSGFGRPSRKLRDQIEDARAVVAASFGADPVEIVFTSAGSESINTAIASACSGRASPRVVSSRVEHSATLAAIELHAPNAELLAVNSDGLIDIDSANLQGADLVSLIWANNEVGTINDVAAFDAACGKAGVALHLDAVCTAGMLAIDLHALPNLTFASFSAHKLHGLAGCGFLYVRRGTRFRPLIAGGHQERGRRAGTENLAGILALAAALEDESFGDLSARVAKMLALRERLEAGLVALGGVVIHGAGVERLVNTTSVAFEGKNAIELLEGLDKRGVYASAGSACTTGSLEPSHVLRAMGVDDNLAAGTLRFSNSVLTSQSEIDFALGVIRETLG